MLDDYLRVFFDPAKFLLTVGRWLLFQDLMFQASRPTVVDANVELEINVGLDVASMPQHANAARKRSRSDAFDCGDVVAEAH